MYTYQVQSYIPLYAATPSVYPFDSIYIPYERLYKYTREYLLHLHVLWASGLGFDLLTHLERRPLHDFTSSFQPPP